MADLPSVEQVQAFFNSLDANEAKAFFQHLLNGTSNAKDAMMSFANETTKAGNITARLAETVESVKEKISFLEDFSFKNFISEISAGNKHLIGLTAQIGLVTAVLASGIKPDAFNALSESANNASADISRTSQVLEQSAGKFPVLDKVVKGLSVLYQHGQQARNFENSMLTMASASGELGTLLQQTGTDLSGLTNQMVTFTDITYEAAQASGMSLNQVAGLAAELNKIPGALSTVVKDVGATNDQLNLLDAVMKVAAGTGQNTTDVIKDLDHVYREFNTTGKNSLEYVARLSAASQGLRIPLDIVKGYTQGAADGFRFFGDNSQAAINILGRFGPALQNSGLGPKAIADLTRGMTDNISKFSLAQNAFLSQSTGGPGGLAGGYQVELLKQQGKLDEVQKLVEQSLRKQFGGRIVTLEEAAQDQAAAGQFTRQVQLLTQGPTKIANTEAEAYKIIDAMAKGLGSPESTKGLLDKTDSLNQAFEVGNAFQERNNNQLTQMSNQVEMGVMYSSIIANNTSRMLSGETGVLGDHMFMSRRKASARGTDLSLTGGEYARTPLNIEEAVLERGKNFSEIDFEKTFLDAKDKAMNKFIKPEMMNLEGSIVNPKKTLPQEEIPLTQTRVKSELLQNENIKNNKEDLFSTPNSYVVEVHNSNTCPSCQHKEMTKVAEIVSKGKIQDVKSNENKHIHTGVTLG